MSKYRKLIWHYFLNRLPAMKLSLDTKNGRLTFSNKDLIGSLLYINRAYEWEKIQLVMDYMERFHLERNKVFLDVGANLGMICIPLIQQRFFTKAVAIEPDQHNYDLLVRNVDKNNLSEKVITKQLALSDQVGTAKLYLSENNFGDHQLSIESKQFTNARQFIEVPMLTMDMLLQNLSINPRQVGLLWMDVQGHEFNVLKGARTLINESVPIFMEFYPQGLRSAGVSPDMLVSLLKDSYDYFINVENIDSTPQPIKDIKCLFEQYTGEHFTDILIYPIR